MSDLFSAGDDKDIKTEELMENPSTSTQSSSTSSSREDQSAVGAEGGNDSNEDTLSERLKKMNIPDSPKMSIPDSPPPVLEGDLSLASVARYLQSDRCKRVILMVGAGISTSAGIPDFRSPTGIYANLLQYNVPRPESMFDIHQFVINPDPFYRFAKDFFSTQYKPTLCHYFIRLLNEKGKLLRLYTQNIDTLERVAGIPPDKVVEAHGTFNTSHCLNRRCQKEYSLNEMKVMLFSDENPNCSRCGHMIKPDVIFFGESMPPTFYSMSFKDFKKCDLLIVIGTSLVVHPFAGLVNMVPKRCPRLFINKEEGGPASAFPSSAFQASASSSGDSSDSSVNTRDVFWMGDADDGCQALALALGWKDELQSLFNEEHARLDSASG